MSKERSRPVAMPNRRLFVHIGAPKTGSTMLQSMASGNRALLLTRGLLYPEVCLRGLGHHDWAFMLDGGFPNWAKPAEVSLSGIEKAVGEECRGHHGDILLSSENFSLFPHPEGLRESLERSGLLDGLTPRIIFYLRRQDNLLDSWYNQMVKAQGFSGTLDEVVDNPPEFLDYDAQLEAWAESFGQTALDVRIYEEACRGPGGLAGDFWGEVCAEAGLHIAAGPDVNRRLRRDLLEIQRIINRLPLSIVQKRGLHQEFMALSYDGTEPDRFGIMTRALRDRIEARYRDGNSRVAARVFGRDQLFEARTTPNDDPDPYPGLTVEKAVAAMAEAVLRRWGGS